MGSKSKRDKLLGDLVRAVIVKCVLGFARGVVDSIICGTSVEVIVGMLPLDSPRWNELRQAYGSAGNVPGLLKSAADDEDQSVWEDIWSSLCHQYSIYSATYAAIPHLVSTAEHTSLRNRLEVLIFCSTVKIFGRLDDETVPDDLIHSYESALDRVKGMSLELTKEASDGKLLERYPLPFLIQAVLGLQFGSFPSICVLDRFAESDCEVEAECSKCGSGQYFDLANLPDEVIGKSAKSQDLRIGLSIVSEKDLDLWPSDCIVSIAAALASSLGDDNLSALILNLNAEVSCEDCGHQYRLSEALSVL